MPFSIEKSYQDEFVCDVVEMDAFHILLGRPWQFDVYATYKGRDNVYSLWWQDRKIILLPVRDKGPNMAQGEELSTLFTVCETQLLEEENESKEIWTLVVKGEESAKSSKIHP